MQGLRDLRARENPKGKIDHLKVLGARNEGESVRPCTDIECFDK